MIGSMDHANENAWHLGLHSIQLLPGVAEAWAPGDDEEWFPNLHSDQHHLH